MKNLFALIGAGAVAFAGFGWYLDWYKLGRQPAPAGTQRLTVDLNPDKITGDLRKGVERGSEIIDRLREGNPNNNSAAPQAAEKGPATDFFTPPSATPPNSPWKSLDSPPPPLPVPQR